MNRYRLPLLLPLSLVLGGVAPAGAETPEEKGLRIAQAASDRDEGWGDYRAAGTMVLRNRQGQESVRRFHSSALEVPQDGDKTLMVFTWPGDIEGTALLTIAHDTADDDQWLYLPALKRVKRISSGDRSGSFLGSEFAYEDLVPQAVEKYSYAWLRDEPCSADAQLACFVYERYPTKDSGYSRQVVWRDKEEYRVIRIDYYDRKGAHLKTLTAAAYAEYLDRYWRPGEMLMVNHQNGKSTLLHWSEYEFGTGLREQDFSRRALERAR
jgi:Outer membrane lipoprotein-sorting protein